MRSKGASGISLIHDVEYEEINATLRSEGAELPGWYDLLEALESDKKLVANVKGYLERVKNPDYKDKWTGRKPSKRAVKRAERMLELFEIGAWWLKLDSSIYNGPVIKHKEGLKESKND